MKTSKLLTRAYREYLQRITSVSLLLLPVLHSVRAQEDKKPNIILILTDDQGWTCTSQFMDNHIPNSKSDFFETPNIERLASHGMRFTNGYAPCGISCPSRRSIQYGQTPARQGDILFQKNYNPELKKQAAIPQVMKSIDPSYRTAHYGKWDLRANIFPEDLGYDESDGNTGNRNGDVSSDKDSKFTKYYLNNDPKRIETITGRAINFMSRQVRSNHPFYLQISHYATHVDIQTKEETFNKYLNKNKNETPAIIGWAGMLENLDTGIGKILDMIDSLGISDNTYLILMSDNGGVELIPPIKNKFDHPSTLKTHTRNYPLRGGKWTLYEGGIRVPFIVSGPGIKPGSQCDIPVAGWDLLPTFCDLAGGKNKIPSHIDGISLRPLLENGNSGIFKRENDEMVFHYYGKTHSSIRIGDYKLIKFWDLNKIELYNLKEDIGELKDLSQKEPKKRDELESRLMSYLKTVHAEVLDPSLKKQKKSKEDDN